MRNVLIILFLICSLTGFTQTVIESKSYIKANLVTNKDTYTIFSPGAYADYTVKPTADGIYTFTLNLLNQTPDVIVAYIWSPATSTWASSKVPINPTYQDVSIKVTLKATTTYIRLYFANLVWVNKLSYKLDPAPVSEIETLNKRIATLEKTVQTLNASLSGKSDVTAQISAIDALVKKTQAELTAIKTLTYIGFPGGKDTIENRILSGREEYMRSLKVGDGTMFDQLDNVKGIYIKRKGVWVFVK